VNGVDKSASLSFFYASSTTTAMTNALASFVIGQIPGIGGNPAFIDDVYVFNRPLTPEEVKGLYILTKPY
jgi:hypothetical protein